jgi:OmpA-OmpF porin, OOP family
MKTLAFSSVALAVGIGLASTSFAQTTTTPGTTTPGGSMESWRMPYERGFWGHAGLSVGRAEVDVAGTDEKSDFWRLYAGGRFNNAVGLEVGGLRFGDFGQGGIETDGYGLDFALVAGFPIGANSAIFGKLGAVWARTETAGAGSERGWGPRYGIGGQLGLTPQWALRADWDRYDVKFVGGREDVDTLTLGVQYTFR